MFVAVSITLLPLLAGCSGPQGPGAGGDLGSPDRTPREFDSEGELLINGGAGILNPGFEYWADDLPLHWSVMRAREGRAMPSGEKTEGLRGLATGPGYNYTRIEQRMTLEGDFAGRRLTFSADVKTSSPETSRLELWIDGEVAAQGKPHSGDGEWERLEVSAPLPDGFADEPVDAVLSHYDRPSSTCFFDDARLDIDGQ